MFNNLRDARAQIELLGNQATALTARAESAEAKVSEIDAELVSARSEKEAAEAKVIDITARAEKAEGEVTALTAELATAKAAVADFDKKVQAAATGRAVSQVSASGHPPVEGDSTGGSTGSGAEANAITRENFWDKWREQPVVSRSQWYNKNKSVIDR